MRKKAVIVALATGALVLTGGYYASARGSAVAGMRSHPAPLATEAHHANTTDVAAQLRPIVTTIATTRPTYHYPGTTSVKAEPGTTYHSSTPPQSSTTLTKSNTTIANQDMSQSSQAPVTTNPTAQTTTTTTSTTTVPVHRGMSYWTTRPSIPQGWRWVSIPVSGSYITQVWFPAPDSWSAQTPEDYGSGYRYDGTLWADGIVIATHHGTSMKFAREVLWNPKRQPFHQRPSVDGQMFMETSPYEGREIAAGVTQDAFIANGSRSIRVNLSMPPGQQSQSSMIMHDLRFTFAP